MNTWGLTLEAFSQDLARRQAIPRGVVRLFKGIAGAEPSKIVRTVNAGELANLIRSLDPVSLQLAIEFAVELRTEFEEAGAFEEAAAIDLVADRLQDELVVRPKQ